MNTLERSSKAIAYVLRRAGAAALLSCAFSMSALAQQPLNVLFVGNSYTYTHNLPEVFRRVAASHGHDVNVRSLVAPNVAIEDHFTSGDLQRELSGNWDLVVLQQGPSSLPASQQHLRYWTGEVARRIDPEKTRIVMFSVWPSLMNEHTWTNAEISYTNAAASSGGCIFPAAAAWRLALTDNPGLRLFSADGLHPSREGTLLAALTLGRALWGAPSKIGGRELERQFSESSWSAALSIAPRLATYASQAVSIAKPRCG